MEDVGCLEGDSMGADAESEDPVRARQNRLEGMFINFQNSV